MGLTNPGDQPAVLRIVAPFEYRLDGVEHHEIGSLSGVEREGLVEDMDPHMIYNDQAAEPEQGQ